MLKKMLLLSVVSTSLVLASNEPASSSVASSSSAASSTTAAQKTVVVDAANKEAKPEATPLLKDANNNSEADKTKKETEGDKKEETPKQSRFASLKSKISNNPWRSGLTISVVLAAIVGTAVWKYRKNNQETTSNN